MRSARGIPLWLARYFVPAFLLVLIVRMLILNGAMALILDACWLFIVGSVYILLGGVPSILFSLFVVRILCWVIVSWIKLFAPSRPTPRGRRFDASRRGESKVQPPGTEKRPSNSGKAMSFRNRS